MSSAIEQLPTSIENGRYFLRIKKRDNGKKWCVRYVGKIESGSEIRKGWTYTTKVQAWGNRLESTADRMLRLLIKKGYIRPEIKKKKI